MNPLALCIGFVVGTVLGHILLALYNWWTS